MVVHSMGCAWFRHQGLLLFTCTVITNFFSVVNAGCAAGPSILTTEGCTACEDYSLCRGFVQASDCVGPNCKTDGNCTFECMSVNANSATLAVLVEFGDYQSEEEVAAGTYNDTELSEYPDETSNWPSVSNNQVDTLGAIDLSSAVATFIVSGGSSTEVTKVVLQNLDLGMQFNLLPDYLPSSVETLDLSNTLLSEFPTEFSDMSSLQRLLLDYNYLTTVSANDVIDSITTLSLDNNNIDTFEGVFPELEYLYLGKNKLTSIPSVIYRHTKLKTLNLVGNTFSSRYFTIAQVNFLKNLNRLGLSESDFQVDVECDDTEQSIVHGVTVCVTDKDSTIGDDSDSSRSTTVDGLESNTSTSSNTMLTRLALGFVYGISAVILIGIFLFTSLRKKKERYPNMNDTIEYNGDHSLTPESELQQIKKIYSGQYESSGRVMGIASQSSGFSMGISTFSYGDDDSIDIPVLEASSVSTSKFTSFVTTSNAESRTMPIWNDYELLSLQLCVASIKDIEQIGSGGYATVWLVRYRNLQLLASKRLRPERCTKKNIWAFVDEIKLVANFDHPNIVKFVGAAWTMESDLQMILEYMDGGDLRLYLSDPSTRTGWTYLKFGIAIGIIEALVYLHSFVPPLLHRDIKSKNVLLSSTLKPKLSDFGKSRFRSEHNTMSGGIGTGRWLAPEVIRGDTDYDRSADIYSFGVLLTELDTNEIPYSNTRGPNGKVLSDTTIMHRVASGSLYPKVRSTCARALKKLVERCLVQDPAKRPTAPEVVSELRVIQQGMAMSLSKRAPWTTDFIGRAKS